MHDTPTVPELSPPHPRTAEPWSAIQLFVRLGQVGKVRRLWKMSCPRRVNFETDARLEGNPGQETFQEQMAAALQRKRRTGRMNKVDRILGSHRSQVVRAWIEISNLQAQPIAI